MGERTASRSRCDHVGEYVRCGRPCFTLSLATASCLVFGSYFTGQSRAHSSCFLNATHATVIPINAQITSSDSRLNLNMQCTCRCVNKSIADHRDPGNHSCCPRINEPPVQELEVVEIGGTNTTRFNTTRRINTGINRKSDIRAAIEGKQNVPDCLYPIPNDVVRHQNGGRATS